MTMKTHLSASAQMALAQHLANTAKSFNAEPGQMYNVTPSVAQSMMDKIIERADPFLQSINFQPVSELKGEKIFMALSGRVASRTDTSSTGERVPKHLVGLSNKFYELFPTEFDVALKYAQIDAWSKFPDFTQRYMNLVRQAIRDDILVCGWYGESAENATVIGSNPNLEDLNIGWLEILRDFNSGSQHLAGTVQDPVALGSADIANLDVLVHQARQMIAKPFRNRNDLVVMIGNDLLSSQEETYYETNGNTPTEKAMLSGRITRAYGGLPTISPPFFPDGAMLVTPLSNMSVYYQDSSVRRLQKDKPEKNEVQDFNSMNMGYVVEQEEAAAFIETITIAAA